MNRALILAQVVAILASRHPNTPLFACGFSRGACDIQHTYIHIYIHTYMHTYIHTYIRIYMQACIHTYILSMCPHTTYIHRRPSPLQLPAPTCNYLYMCPATSCNYLYMYPHTTHIHRRPSPLQLPGERRRKKQRAATAATGATKLSL